MMSHQEVKRPKEEKYVFKALTHDDVEKQKSEEENLKLIARKLKKFIKFERKQRKEATSQERIIQ